MQSYIYADRFFLKYKEETEGYLEIIDGKFGDYQKEIREDGSTTIID
ncbi:hypothetical protein [Heyndrickxia coagulans]|uniref:Uncharacterized protein n=1 Tax=Heyndrickxia coagulans TaxID=1398 RepID=A0A133KZV2_HEYCO|nr:hypothetical protein [Heyndrickxia coagulans]KWZ85154.1 hypothetical protein HMPREF3213_00587 [Heyndrickxia coagulans]